MFGVKAFNRLFHKTPSSFVDALVDQGFVQKEDVEGLSGKPVIDIERFMLEKKLCGPEEIAQAYSAYFELPYVKLTGKEIKPEIINLLPENIARAYSVAAYAMEGNELHLAVGTPAKLQMQAPAVLAELSRRKNIEIILAVTTPADIMWALSLYNQPTKKEESKTEVAQIELNKEQDKKISANLPNMDLSKINIPNDVLTKFPKEVAEKYKIVVFGVEPAPNISPVPKKIKVAVLDSASPQVRDILDFIKRRNGIEIEEYQGTKEGINKALEGYSRIQLTDQIKGQKSDEARPPITKEANQAAQTTISIDGQPKPQIPPKEMNQMRPIDNREQLEGGASQQQAASGKQAHDPAKLFSQVNDIDKRLVENNPDPLGIIS